jgi:small subunit ribosomal protein S21
MTNLVILVPDGNVEGALTRFKRSAMKAGLFKEIRRHEFYMKPGERRRRKAKVARSRLAKTERRRAAGEVAMLLRRGQTDI